MKNINLYKVGVVAGAILSVSHYFMTAVSNFLLGNLNLYTLLSELNNEYLYMYFWPQVVLTVVTVISAFVTNKVFVMAVLTTLAYAFELFMVGGEFYESLDTIPTVFFLGVAGVLIMLFAAFMLKKEVETGAPLENAKHDEERIAERLVNINNLSLNNNEQKAYIEFISGELEGAKVEVCEELTIGKNPNTCNLILSNPKCSRVHCTINYDKKKDVFLVKDVSTNGLYANNIGKLTKDTEYEFSRGAVFSIADTEDRFKLY